MSHVWSSYQEAIFKDVESGRGHTVVIARAGSGKTSTIVESFLSIPKGKTAMMCAFNKSIATELAERVKRLNLNVQVKTLHSYGLSALRSLKPRIDNDKIPNYLRERFGDEKETLEFRNNVTKLISVAKANLFNTKNQLDDLIDRFNLDFDDVERAIDAALAGLKFSYEQNRVVDFDDMIYLPLALNYKPYQFDRVFIDETQDLNPAQIELALKAVKSNGRIMAVGDNFQAIYQFRGADENAVDNVIQRLKAKTLPLSVTYRCCKAVVRLAQTLVPDIEAAPDAIEGAVETVTFERMKKEAAPGDFILSRVNAPLIGLCLGFLKEGRRANIQGRDVGASLTSLIKKSKAKTVENLEQYVDKWREREVKRLQAKGRDVQPILDRADCILALAEDANSIADIEKKIDNLFTDDVGGKESKIILSSIHKSKGDQAPRVWVLKYTLRVGKSAEESNIAYVAYTRTIKHLFLVQKPN